MGIPLFRGERLEMKIFWWTILTMLFLLNIHDVMGAEKRLIVVEEASYVGEEQLDDIADSESQKAEGEGYLAHPAAVQCFAAMKYYYTGGRYNNTPIFFRLHKPQKIVSGKKYPLIVDFHGEGESGDDNTSQLSHFQIAIKHLTGPESSDFYCLVTQCPGDNHSFLHSVSKDDDKGDAPLTIAKEIMDIVIQEYPIDENRISLFGICSGGQAAWDLACSQPDRFASLVLCSASPPANLHDAFKLKSTYIWSFNNANDESAPIDDCRQAINAINENGGLAFLDEKPDGGHDTWRRALQHKGVMKWMSLQSKDSFWLPPDCFPVAERSFALNFFLFFLPVGIICGLSWYMTKNP